MIFSKTIECPGSAESLTKLLKNPTYYDLRWKHLDPKANVDINTTEKQIRVTTNLDISEDTVRSISNLVNSGIQMRIVEIWDLNPDQIAEKGSISASLTGVPAKASAALRISSEPGQGKTTTIHLEGDVTCTVPLIGTGLEKAFVKRLDWALHREIKVMKQILSRHANDTKRD